MSCSVIAAAVGLSMRCIFPAIMVMCSVTQALADNWAVQETDKILSRDAVQALTTGRTMIFYDDGQSKYSAGGAYSYTYASGESAFGTYAIEDDGTVCIAYRNGFGRCDRYVESASGRIVLLTQDGLRFPVRPQAE